MKVAAVVLAGGEGRRMQGPKPLQALAGRTLLDIALERARAVSGQVAVAVRSPDQLGGVRDLDVLEDDPSIPGPLAGIASALRFGREQAAERVLTLPCDCPFLPPDLLQRLSAAMTDRTGCVMAASGGRLHPVCALWRPELGPALETYAATGRAALMGLADMVGWAAVDWPTQPVDPFMNINTPQDLERANTLWSG